MISISSKSVQIIGEIVQRGLTTYPNNLRVVQYCFLTISELSSEPANCAYLGNIGICHLVVQTIESLHFKLTSVDHPVGNSSSILVSSMKSEMDDSFDEDNTGLGTTSTNTPREREEVIIEEMVIFESGLKAIATLAMIETNSQILSDCNVGDIILNIASIYFSHEHVMIQVTLALTYLTKLTSTRNLLINNQLIPLLLKILGSYSNSPHMVELWSLVVLNIMQSGHMEGCRELIEGNLQSSLGHLLEHYYRKHLFVVQGVLEVYVCVMQFQFPQKSALSVRVKDEKRLSKPHDQTTLPLQLDSLCEKICLLLRSHNEMKGLCLISCSLLTLLCSHYPECSQQLHQLGYGELSLTLLHEQLNQHDPSSPLAPPQVISTMTHIIRSQNLIIIGLGSPSCQEFLTIFSDSQFLDFLYHDVVAVYHDQEFLIQEVLSLTSHLMRAFPSLYRLEALVLDQHDEEDHDEVENYLDHLFQIISSYPSKPQLLTLCMRIMSCVYSSLSHENDEFLSAHPQILFQLDSIPSLVETALKILKPPITTSSLSFTDQELLECQHDWMLLLKSLTTYSYDREMIQIIEQIQESTPLIIQLITELLLKQKTIMFNNDLVMSLCSNGYLILGFLASLNPENMPLLSQAGYLSYSMNILITYHDIYRSASMSPSTSTSIPDSVVAMFDTLTYSLSILSSSHENRLILRDLNLCRYVGNVLLLFLTTEELVNNCCQIITNLALMDDHCKGVLGAYGACDGCYQALSLYSERSVDIAKNACYACMSLVIDDQNKRRMSETTMCEEILRALDYYTRGPVEGGGDEEFLGLGLSALINLTDHNVKNKDNLCHHGTSIQRILENILKIQESHYHHRLLELCLMLLVNLTEDEHSSSLQIFSDVPFFQFILQVICQCSDAAAAAVTQQLTDVEAVCEPHSASAIAVCEQGLWYFKNLFNNPHLSPEFCSFLSLNVQILCELILDIVSTTCRLAPPVLAQASPLSSALVINTVIVEQACQCLRPLLLIVPMTAPDILIKLNTFQILLNCCCSCSVASAEEKEEEVLQGRGRNERNETLLISALFLLNQLLAYCSNYSTMEIETLLERLCVIHEVVTGILMNHSTNQFITVHCLHIIYDVYQRNNYASDTSDMVKDWSDTAEGVVCALDLHYTSQEIVILSSELIILFSETSREYQSVIGATGGGEALVQSIIYYLDDTHLSLALVAHCLHACNSLLQNNAANVVMVGSKLRQLLLHIFPVIQERYCCPSDAIPMRYQPDTSMSLINEYGFSSTSSDLIENTFLCLKRLAGSNKQFFIESGVLRYISEILIWHQEDSSLGPQPPQTEQGELLVSEEGSKESRHQGEHGGLPLRSLQKMHTHLSSLEDPSCSMGSNPSIPSLIAGCDALLVLLDCVDITHFEGIDLPSGLLTKLLIFHQDYERYLQPYHRQQRADLLHKALQLILTILRLDLTTTNPKNKRVTSQHPLLPHTFQLLLYHPSSVALVDLFLSVVRLEGYHSLIVQEGDVMKLQEVLQNILEDLRQEQQELTQQERHRGDDLGEYSEMVIEQLQLFLQNSFRR
jgi:hypothetical protein